MKNFWERRKSPTRDFIEKYSDEIAILLEWLYVVVAGVIIFGGVSLVTIFMFAIECEGLC